MEGRKGFRKSGCEYSWDAPARIMRLSWSSLSNKNSLHRTKASTVTYVYSVGIFRANRRGYKSFSFLRGEKCTRRRLRFRGHLCQSSITAPLQWNLQVKLCHSTHLYREHRYSSIHLHELLLFPFFIVPMIHLIRINTRIRRSAFSTRKRSGELLYKFLYRD